jgi:alanine-synthesizing transaminase
MAGAAQKKEIQVKPTIRMFSSRLDWEAGSNRLMETLRGKRREGVRILDLTETNPTAAGFAYDEREILAAIAHPAAMRYEPSPRGLPAARKAVSEYYREKGAAADSENILVTASTSEAYAFLFKLLADPGSEILIPRPGYPLIDYLAGLEHLKPIRYPVRYIENEGWRIDPETVGAFVTPRTAAIVAVSPSNPTGNYLKRAEMDGLNRLCRDVGLPLLIDEVFSDYGCGEDSERIETAVAEEATLTFVLNGLSKVAGLPQFKLGWMHVNGPPALRHRAIERLELIADTYLSVGSPVQHAAARLLPLRKGIQRQIASRIDRNFSSLKKTLSSASKARVLIREGGWYAVIETGAEISDEERAFQLLKKRNVLVHPGYFYDFSGEGFLVISLLTPEAVFRAGLNELLAEFR